MQINNRTSGAGADDWYEELMNAHRGLSGAQSDRLNAALVLLLSNQVADPRTLRGCISSARVAALLPEKG